MHQIVTDIPSYEVMNQCGKSHILHQNQLLLVALEVGIPCVWATIIHGTSPTPCKTTSVGGETKWMLQENNGKAVTQ